MDYIILVCGSAHAFLEDCYKLIPESKEKVLNIIDITGTQLKAHGIKSVLVIAAEGSIESKIYTNNFQKKGISCICPGKECYNELRYFIESVKTNNINQEVCKRFITFLSSFNQHDIVLGCTEFPILTRFIQDKNLKFDYNFWDPLELTIEELKNRCDLI